MSSATVPVSNPVSNQVSTPISSPVSTENSTTATTVGHTDNSILIKAPLDVVWELTNDLASWPTLFTEYASVEILDHLQHDNRDTFRFRLTMHPDANGKVWSWVSERTLDPLVHRVTARRVEPGPFEFMDIEWTYRATPDGTVMRWVQDFRMRPQAPVDTPTMTIRINANSKIQQEVIARKVERAAEFCRAITPLATSEESA